MTKFIVLSIKNWFLNERPDYGTKAQAAQNILSIIKVRWILLAGLFIYGLFTVSTFVLYYRSVMKAFQVVSRPAIILLLVALYNAFCHYIWYRYNNWWISRIKFFTKLQFFLDILIVTFLVYATGGIVSWFWTLYILLFVEYSQLIPGKQENLVMGLTAIFFFTLLVFGQFYSLIKHVNMPFVSSSLYSKLPYFFLRWLWVCLLTTIAIFATLHFRGRERLAVKDSLTNLYSRRFFDHILNSEFNRAKRFGRTVSLLMIDVDDFKRYNDTFGHTEGDIILKNVAEIIGYNIRRSTKEPTYDIDIACRYGGEEIAIILPETGNTANLRKTLNELRQTNGALILADKLRKQVAEATEVTISVGIATFPSHCHDCKGLVKQADRALYKAKVLGKNKVVVASSIKKKRAEEYKKVVKVAQITKETGKIDIKN